MLINRNVPYSVSWLLTNNCNYECGFCWRVLDRRNIGLETAMNITTKLSDAGMVKMSWAGGEPLLFRGIGTLIKKTSELGVETMLITNGSLIDRIFPAGLPRELDWLTLPLEGVDDVTNRMVGRQVGHFDRVVSLLDRYRLSPLKLKINSVATRLNLHSLYRVPEFLNDWRIARWKVFQFYPIRGFAIQNHAEFGISDSEFLDFRSRLLDRCIELGVQADIVIETNRDLDNSYYTLSPDGCVYVSDNGTDIYLGDLKCDDPEVVFEDPRLDKAKYDARSNWILDPRRTLA
ncbi:radical SAM protein [Nocardia beijingensis]|uniref:S-adenosylmethionine-dependent nucleotide dehydratase n=1 Tax=Nocardia beijingensis TaxID=95162 RepID=A0ABW7W7S6_9NOCA